MDFLVNTVTTPPCTPPLPQLNTTPIITNSLTSAKDGATPLSLAALHAHDAAVRLLLAREEEQLRQGART
jgi:ankyrin repeat protein